MAVDAGDGGGVVAVVLLRLHGGHAALAGHDRGVLAHGGHGLAGRRRSGRSGAKAAGARPKALAVGFR